MINTGFILIINTRTCRQQYGNAQVNNATQPTPIYISSSRTNGPLEGAGLLSSVYGNINAKNMLG